jgi:hypothetical protein
MKIWIYISLFLFTSLTVKAQFAFNQNCKTAFETMVEFRFEEAQSLLEKERKIHPNNLMVDYVSNYISFLKAANSEFDKDEEAFLKNSEKLLKKIHQTKAKSPYRAYCITDIYLQRAIIWGRNKAYIKAYNNLRDAQQSIDENIENYPRFIPNQKAKAIMHLGFGSIPESYAWILGVLNIDADVNKGLQMLANLNKECLSNSSLKYLQTESILLSSFAHSNLSNKSDDYLTEVFEGKKNQGLFKHNPLLCFAKISFYQHSKLNEKAIQTYQDFSMAKGADNFYFLDFIYGESILYKLDQQAKIYFQRYINHFPGQSYRKAAFQKIAWLHLINNNEEAYRKTLAKVDDYETSILDADKQAQKAHDENRVPHISLLKSRLLFDGGYYQKAINQLLKGAQNKEFESQDLKLEYLYRMGRIYDEWGKDDKALNYYQQAIDQGKSSSRYFAANAALMSGLIYENRGQTTKAKAMFQQCLDMDFDEYYDSITQKAKAGLNRLQ